MVASVAALRLLAAATSGSAQLLLELAADELDTLRQQLVDDKVSHLTALGEKQMLIDQLRKERDEARAVARRYYVGMPDIGQVGGRFMIADEIVKAWPAPEKKS